MLFRLGLPQVPGLAAARSCGAFRASSRFCSEGLDFTNPELNRGGEEDTLCTQRLRQIHSPIEPNTIQQARQLPAQSREAMRSGHCGFIAGTAQGVNPGCEIKLHGLELSPRMATREFLEYVLPDAENVIRSKTG